MVSVREGNVEDLDVLIQLLRRKAEFDRVPGAVKATAEMLRETLFGESPRAQVLLAECEGRAVGFASYHEHYSTFLGRIGVWLDDLYIEEAFRGRGIGKAMFQHLCRIAIERGATRIEWHVAADNARGIGFYEAIGASVKRAQYPASLGEEQMHRLAR